MKLKDDILLEQAYTSVLEEAKKKVNPWAVCNASTSGKKKEPEKFEKCVKGVKKKTGYTDNKKGKKKVVKENIAPSTTPQTQQMSYAKTGGYVNSQNKDSSTQTNVDDPYIKIEEIRNTTQDPNLKKQLDSILAQRNIEKLKNARDEQSVQQTQGQASSPQM
jgi:hypothetical protein